MSFVIYLADLLVNLDKGNLGRLGTASVRGRSAWQMHFEVFFMLQTI